MPAPQPCSQAPRGAHGHSGLGQEQGWSIPGPGAKTVRPIRGVEDSDSWNCIRRLTPSAGRPGMVESPPGGGLAGGSLCQGARHSWPLIWATHAYSLNPLPLPILRAFSAQGCDGCGELGKLARGHQGSGEPPGLVTASGAFLARCSTGGRAEGGVGGGGVLVGDEREEGRKGENRERQSSENSASVRA